MQKENSTGLVDGVSTDPSQLFALRRLTLSRFSLITLHRYLQQQRKIGEGVVRLGTVSDGAQDNESRRTRTEEERMRRGKGTVLRARPGQVGFDGLADEASAPSGGIVYGGGWRMTVVEWAGGDGDSMQLAAAARGEAVETRERNVMHGGEVK